MYSKLRISITSNAQLIPFDFVKRLKEKISYLTISLNTLEEKIAKILQGNNYSLDKVLWAAQEATQNGLSIKINTVISNINIEEVSDIGKFIKSLDLSKTNVIWKIIKFHRNPYVLNKLPNFEVTQKEFSNLDEKIKKKYPDLNIISIDNNMIDQSYILIAPTGEVIIPSYHYKSIGNVIKTPLQHLIDQNIFSSNNRLLRSLSGIIKKRD